MDWKKMPEGKEKYAAYLCSREWSVLKEAVKSQFWDLAMFEKEIRSNG